MAASMPINNNSREVVKTVVLRLCTDCLEDRTLRADQRGAGKRALYTTRPSPFLLPRTRLANPSASRETHLASAGLARERARCRGTVTYHIHGLHKRTIVPFIVTHGEEARWVFFIVDSGSPWTYLSTHVRLYMTSLLLKESN